ncbi:hypothetical protein F2Q69_00047788 [Brassica cretica]|uniref:Uncharacterized protein n=1 Tax=Brassica cretica TaxID=69181 RepID=A0A8S9PXS9_BRACR|nr:hypothetical protein F2Q69_00047788 [Brassica cretica]
MELMKGGMKDHAHAETLISPIDGRIQGFWDPIPVSPDTVETTTDFAGDDEEVNYPADTFGAFLARPRFTLGFKVCAVTSWLSIFLLRFLPDSYRFKVRDRFSAYMTSRFRTCVVRSKIKRVIKLRLFKMADVFVGANRRTECKVFVVAFGQFVRIVSTFNLATSRIYFEDYTNIFGAEERLFRDFGLYEAADKSLNEYDEDYDEERAAEYRAILVEEDKLLHHSSWKRNAPSIDKTVSTSIDTQPHQRNRKRASTDIAYYPSIDTGVDHVREGDYSIGSWADDHHHESYAVETTIHEQ